MGTRIGNFLGRYELVAEIGRGAMGVVYRARDPKLDRIVAIKTVSVAGVDAAAEQDYRKRFVVEARAAGCLSHPGVVAMFDVSEEEPEPYLIMEYVKGQSLQALISRENRTLPLSTTLQLVQQVAEALHYAHAQGVVHLFPRERSAEIASRRRIKARAWLFQGRLEVISWLFVASNGRFLGMKAL